MEIEEIEEHYESRKKHLLAYRSEYPRWHYRVLARGLEVWYEMEMKEQK